LNLKDCFDRGLLKKGKPDPDNALRSLGISEDFLEKARKNVRIECYDVSVMLSYTSMFHAARAVLFKDGIKERSHACVPVYLKENYPGLRKLADTLDSYREFRHGIVYRAVGVGKSDADEAMNSADEFLSRIRKIIQ
jgi:uncharacterized protein (UPF0332 family)